MLARRKRTRGARPMRKVRYESLPRCLRLLNTVDAKSQVKEIEYLLCLGIEHLKTVENESERETLEGGIELAIALRQDLLDTSEGRNALPFYSMDESALTLQQVLDAGFAVLEVTEMQRSREAQGNA